MVSDRVILNVDYALGIVQGLGGDTTEKSNTNSEGENRNRPVSAWHKLEGDDNLMTIAEKPFLSRHDRDSCLRYHPPFQSYFGLTHRRQFSVRHCTLPIDKWF